MRKFLILFGLVFTGLLSSESYITYEFSGGRFGDCLLSYLHAKWLSYKYQLPLLYKPFKYSSDLCLDAKEQAYPSYSYRIHRKLSRQNPSPDFGYASCIYECPYFPEDPSDRWLNPQRYRIEVDWKDKQFRKIVREMISPKVDLVLTIPPASTINIAIHIREGGGYDTDHTRLYDPLKLPPLSFYIEGLREVLDLFVGHHIYCYLFTDAADPALLAVELAKNIPDDASVQIDFRKIGNHHAANVLEDFFSLFQFDALIRPQSNYSIVASCIHDFAVVFFPTNFQRAGNQITITEMILEKNEEIYQDAIARTAIP